MTYYEGLLVSQDATINLAAIGAEIEDSNLGSQIYRPSDTARNLCEGSKFTYSLCEDPELFFNAALTGHNEPDTPEIDRNRLEYRNDFYYPKDATKVYFCEVERTAEVNEKDEYGEADIKLIEAEILDVEGEGEYIGRENPLVDAMVHATRLYVAEEEQKERIVEKVRSVLSEDDSELKARIIDFVEGMKR